MINKTFNANKVKVANIMRDMELHKKPFYTIFIGEGASSTPIFFTEISYRTDGNIYLYYNGTLISIVCINYQKIHFEI